MDVGKYQLIRKLAAGGMAEVFLAKAVGPGGFEKTLVLKRILPHLAEDPSFVEMFLGEARLVARLNHPHIVQIFDFGESEGTYFLAMEFIDGPNLRRWRREARSRGLLLPPNICAKVVALAAEGLAFAHDFEDPVTGQALGLIHRDVSPDNILVSRQGAVKVVDFGIAKVVGQKHRTQTGMVKGKVPYMPPEQVRGEPLDRRVDVYALGVVLYELLTGHLPFEEASAVATMHAVLEREPVPVSRHREDIPQALQSIISVALRKKREDRYPDCRALQADLERFVMSTGEPVGAYQLARSIALTVDEHVVPTPVTMTPSEDAPVPTTPLESEGVNSTAPEWGGPTAELREATEPRPRGESRAAGKWVVPAVLMGCVLIAAAGGWVMLGGERASAPGVTQAVGGGDAPGVQERVVEPVREEPPLPGARGDTGGAVMPMPVARDDETTGHGVDAGSEVRVVQVEPGEADEEPSALVVKQGGRKEKPRVRRGASAVPASVDTSTKETREKGAAMGSVEFRIRPYAAIYLNGKLLGETPMDIVALPAKRYSVTVVNTQLGKSVTRDLEVTAGALSIFKLNLLQP
ncbi:serine/threonine-protein kinase [Myxococcus stipitatus]|uniref:serine/threonine protein kinase n=1 Tax=Myxococcus stipitatus TaxID=83455 RepID=UPI0030D5E48E